MLEDIGNYREVWGVWSSRIKDMEVTEVLLDQC